MPPRPYADIEARLREEFGGRGPDEVFAAFSTGADRVGVDRPGPPARGCTRGEEVAVKVQYPDIEEIVRTDLRALRRIFGLLRWFMPDQGFDTIYREIREMVLAELDYRAEAAAIERIAANFSRAQVDVRAFPRVIDRAVDDARADHRWIEGPKVADLERLGAAGVDRRAAARAVVEAYCQQIFIDGVYHADPHPGNLLVATPGSTGEPPTIVFLDFGAAAEVREAMRRGMVALPPGRDDPRHRRGS